ncbi:hypothetical protein [Kitasatospora cineracea]|uniref:Uncharacterized protein n=1 Tax=Kitasatospora cineracea TaxID=88074 RepID=A0A8G1XDX8_9ACTN|nr:hypothetical protein [Kitasatospora cineracea]ROR44706.1 hypothetical protein EDD39_2913 [Kitasatospora cineracea]
MSAIRCEARQGGPHPTSAQVVLRVVASRREAASVRPASIADRSATLDPHPSATMPTALVPAALAAAFPDLAPAALQHILGH